MADLLQLINPDNIKVTHNSIAKINNKIQTTSEITTDLSIKRKQKTTIPITNQIKNILLTVIKNIIRILRCIPNMK
jgi:hypothetical protein